jgi:hypothetical protein
MHPFYFGDSDERLFAIYTSAHGREIRDTGVVLCYPNGHEYVRSYRAFRNLALQLGSEGFHVLRFDYYATGDSAGDSGDRSLRRWVADIGQAIDELKDMADVRSVSLVGLRFGATLAAQAASSRSDIDQLVLWDPVASGVRHLEELRRVQDVWFSSRPRPRGANGRSPKNEILGYPMPDALIAEHQDTDIRRVARWAAKRLTVLMSSEPDDGFDWPAYLDTLDVPTAYHVLPTGGDWSSPNSVNHALHAHDMTEAISAVLRGSPVTLASAAVPA